MNQLTKSVMAITVGVVMSFLLLIFLPMPQMEAVAADHNDSKLRFSKLTHSAIGDASLDTRLVVNNIGSSGLDGVAINLGGTSGWGAEMFRVVPTRLDWTTTFTAAGIRDHQRVMPSLRIREMQNRVEGSFVIGYAPSFGDSTYRIEIYDGPLLVFSATGFDSGSESMFSGNDAICDFFGKSQSVALGICEWVVSPFFQQNDDSECEWELTGERKSFMMSDGRKVMGTRIRFIENLTSAPQKAVFNRMSIQASDVETMEVDHESVNQPLPASHGGRSEGR